MIGILQDRWHWEFKFDNYFQMQLIPTDFSAIHFQEGRLRVVGTIGLRYTSTILGGWAEGKMYTL